MEKNVVCIKDNQHVFHGYQEWPTYLDIEFPGYRGCWNMGKEVGYEETHGRQITTYYII